MTTKEAKLTTTKRITIDEAIRMIEESPAGSTPEARFALHGLRTRTNADRAATVAAWAERSAK